MNSSDISYYRCRSCGAVTIFLPTGESYSCLKSNKYKYMPNIDLRKAHRLQDSDYCDHCVNHYGLDLCGCGCGAPIGHCRNSTHPLYGSNQPMQILYGRTQIISPDGWLCKRTRR